MSGRWYRLIVALVGAAVVWANQTYGLHIATTNATTVALGIIAGVLIIVEGHVESKGKGPSAGEFISALGQLIEHIIHAPKDKGTEQKGGGAQ